MSRPSLEIDTTLRYRFTSLMLVTFFDGRTPCFRWAKMRRKLGHSFWTLNHADLLMNGRRLPLTKMSWTDTLRTTEFLVSRMKVQAWQWVALQSGAFWPGKSEGKLALPARCCRLTWYLPTVVRKKVMWRLAENSPWQNLLTAWTQGGAVCHDEHAVWTGWWTG